MKEWLQKHWPKIAMVVFMLLWIGSCSSSTTKSGIIRTQEAAIDSLKLEVVETAKFKEQDFERMYLLFEKHGFEVSGRMLYDNNAIIRKVTRPDDKMKEYSEEIERLNRELEALQND